ncbi:PTS lactose/cellobiose transporter subunit IIA [Actinomycetes bacterium NPDC127524]|uniref:PTS lactose/cellobiose transporter subunit IIA n=1 Tax=Bacillus sp. OV322 TaxID=1882764 RepID=UPI0008E4C3CD|nr:PTS lactose/cellobiose transporter subunit IIA [Bacillus sp. OV322]SFC71300.1 PTS system, cellobiose-specific IIA component [Bacillus sp. OV322]
MEEMELTAFTIISNVGTAKSLVMEALYAAREGRFEEAENKLKESKSYLIEGHKSHSGLIQQEASGKKLEFSLIIMHAEDQMMSAETIGDLVAEMILMYKQMEAIKIKMDERQIQ